MTPEQLRIRAIEEVAKAHNCEIEEVRHAVEECADSFYEISVHGFLRALRAEELLRELAQTHGCIMDLGDAGPPPCKYCQAVWAALGGAE